ncbi:adenosylcobinamide-phosphate synthase CbiB [Roseomonas marmotae]|uniref:Cobalamin biosynthesis protein CobD n=1 Tax=Roseomonas marmotae TaxID=2768161 RepID=A0ABS3KFQ2_9PROT|nr:adenosylcobinamide-phosphate synthase CbiB [Roseomonas marmotae]MBO1075171.1 cobalamin biosynthesis protein CobD [Roseomonas marmotae]QTI79719.1 cobalamin biosynthesis protein CobD [Roseomonas marmotae]
MQANILILTGALLIEALAGYPPFLFRLIRHPVVWFGALIGSLDRHLNSEAQSFARRRLMGVVALLVLLLVAVLPAALLQWALLPQGWAGLAVLAVLAASLPAQRSLHDHVGAVAEGLEEHGLEGGRTAVSMIVGRDPQSLDEAGVVRAATESLAENFSDGVVAPAFWCALGGLPGAVFYKAVNTADSMIGHRSARHAAFGWAAARLDDLINLPASRLSAFWIWLAAALLPGMDAGGAWRAVWRDARHHRSPNAGWPEAAMAGALGLRLAGPRVYGGRRVEDGWMGRGRAEATAADLRRALAIYRLACRLQLVTLAWAAAFLLG